ncbi:MAG TPA: ATP-binding protein, partial [Holophagaceae bacterium]
DPDPLKPARICGCTPEGQQDAAEVGLPARYREADFARFWKWWNNAQAGHARALLDRVGDLEDLLARPVEEVGEVQGREELARLLQALRKRPEHGIRPAGAESLAQWATTGKHRFRNGWELWWIHGPAQSGRSTLAAAAMRAWGLRTGRSIRYVSVRALSQAIKDAYYDVRSFQNQAFQSVRDLVEPLESPGLLVLDDWDRMDTDIRVAAALAQLLDHRYGEELPTILTAAAPPEALDRREGHPLLRLEDSSLLTRLRGAERVEMVPALRPWLDRLARP